ncbi:hypothetical protein [Nocardia sp. NPDC003726]
MLGFELIRAYAAVANFLALQHCPSVVQSQGAFGAAFLDQE